MASVSIPAQKGSLWLLEDFAAVFNAAALSEAATTADRSITLHTQPQPRASPGEWHRRVNQDPYPSCKATDPSQEARLDMHGRLDYLRASGCWSRKIQDSQQRPRRNSAGPLRHRHQIFRFLWNQNA